jgi:hypothetical protein
VIRPATLLLAAVMASPALYRAFVTQELPVESALARFLMAVAAAALMVGALRFITAGYGREGRTMPQSAPQRRRTDMSADGPSEQPG